jgi:hypothetical protein
VADTDSSRDWYDRGVDAYYGAAGGTYVNPHAPAVTAAVREAVARWAVDLSHVLDLAAGAGEVTLALRDRAGRVDGIDPYTYEAYGRATGQSCERLTFEQIARGVLVGRTYSLIVCSYAMHLAALSLLPALATALAQVSAHLLILTPHKRPLIRPAWGWTLQGEFVQDRVRARLYRSTLSAPVSARSAGHGSGSDTGSS